MKTEELKIAAEKAKTDISDEIDDFINMLDRQTDDPEHFITMTELEQKWRELSLKTHKSYSDMVASAISSIESRGLDASKKDSSSGKGSG